MRLLKYDSQGEISLTKDLLDGEIPPYAILSHTWGEDEDEVSFQELKAGPDKSKPGYTKLKLCGDQAKEDKLDYFWVDTCCIDKSSTSDVSENINSMFRYYRDSEKCYVYLSDVHNTDPEKEFGASRWFRRGWTLQELLAPKSIEFFSSKWKIIGSRTTLEQEIHNITLIPIGALQGVDLALFSNEERMSWTIGRETKKKEDKAYCLLGVFGISMNPRYSEGEREAFARLKRKIRKKMKPTLQVIDNWIRDYYLNDGRLDIERLSGQWLAMESCFINLGIIDHSRDGNKGGQQFSQDADQFTLTARLKIETPPQSKQVTLQTLFNPRKLLRGTIDRPKRILVWGQAGVGKTTLCKKIVHDFLQNHLWHDLFDRVFWIPLRRLRLGRSEAMSVAKIIQEFCLHGANDSLVDGDVLHEALENSGNRCLFILDGLDEISYAFDQDSPMGANLDKLFKQDNVIITSRPHSTTVLKRMLPDLELQTIGFYPEQVEEFLRRETDAGNATQSTIASIRSFIEQRPIVRNLVRIPIQLDAICYAWNQEYFEHGEMTMTLLYQAISNRIWQKDVVRLDKKHNGEHVTSQQIQGCADVRHFVQPEISYLGKLAFGGLYNQIAEFSTTFIHAIASDQMPLLENHLSKLSFLRSSDNLLKCTDQTKHFIHLTFQEFFAAQYFVTHWFSGKAMIFPKFMIASARLSKSTEEIMPAAFLQKEKYNVRYDIFWRFVAGLLQMSPGEGSLNQFFRELESEPYDRLGVVHQMLVAHCLNEITSERVDFLEKAQELQRDYGNWDAFALDLYNDRAFLREAACPVSIFRDLLKDSDADREPILELLKTKSSVSSELLRVMIELARHDDDRDTRHGALATICTHCDQLTENVISDLFTTLGTEIWSGALRKIYLKYESVGQSILKHFPEIIQDDDFLMVSDVVRVVEKLSDLPESMIGKIVYILRGQNPDAQCTISSSFRFREQGNLPEPLNEVLAHLLQDENSKVRLEAAATLGQLNSSLEPAIQALVGFARDQDSTYRCHAIYYLGGLKNLPELAIEALISCLQDQDLDIGRAATRALMQRDSLSETVIRTLVRLTQDQDLKIRSRAISALAWRPGLPGTAIEVFIGLGQDQDPEVRRAAPHAPTTQNDSSESIVKSLVSLLRDQDPTIRSDATFAFWEPDSLPEPFVKTLVSLLHDQDSLVRSEAIYALEKHKSLPDLVIEALIPILQDPAPVVRCRAISALGQRDSLSKTVIKALIHLTQDQDADVRCSAAHCLGRQDNISEPAIEALIHCLRDPDLELQLSVVAALENRAEFMQKIKYLDTTTLKNLICGWLGLCFKWQRRLYTVFCDDTFLVEIDGKQCTVTFEAGEREIFEQRWLDAQKALGVPLKNYGSESSNLRFKRKMESSKQVVKKRPRISR